MSAVKFVSEIPEPQRGRSAQANRLLVDELSTRPGTWAEIERRGKSRQGNLAARASYLKKSNPGVEAVTRVVGDEVVLFARVVAA